MSEANVEIVRRILGAWERRDSEGVFEFYDPVIVWDASRGGDLPIKGLYHGHDGVRRFFREWLEAFEVYEAQAETFIDAGDSVVVRFRASGRGKTSGAEIANWVFWLVYRIRDGLVIRIDSFGNEPEALEAAKLEG
jgi:ketosteroid isomerase-like protein